jgi:hypothetical protein
MKREKLITQITDTIHNEVSNPADVYAYCDNCLLFDSVSGAKFHGVSEQEFISAVNTAADRVVEANK